MFKKHKVLPHPRKDGNAGLAVQDLQNATPRRYGGGMETIMYRSSGSQNSSSSLRQKPRRTAGGPEPPPTPPAHSRKSSSSHSVNPSSPTYVASPLQSSENVQSGAPTTPTNQQTPPTPNLTPDRTPPGLPARQAKSRPPISERIPSKVTTDSRTESFRTAPENPYSSGDEDGRSTLRAIPPSEKTSQSTVRLINGGDKKSVPHAVGLGLGLESSPGGDLTPRTAKEFNAFDGEWADKAGDSGGEVETEWDDNLGRNVVVKKRRPPSHVNKSREVIEDLTVTPTMAAKAVRAMTLQESPIVYPSRRVVSDRFPTRPAAPSNSESSISSDLRRSSMMSTRSTASTVVEAILVETAPQRRKTLRHVKKHVALRDSRSDLSPTSSAPTSVSAYVENSPRRRRSNPKLREAPRESHASTATFNSISSRKARREVQKNGGIPVVIIPERRSSVKSSKEPSLRSTSSRRSKRSQSLSSVPPPNASKSKELVLHTERLTRRTRAASEVDGSRPGDQRTMDFPPAIPQRSSSLSAPTSRNASRTGSLTAESLKAHNAFQGQQGDPVLQGVHRMLENLQTEKQEHPHDTPESQPALLPERLPAENGAPKTPKSAHLDDFRPEVLIRRATSIESKSEVVSHPRNYAESHDTHEDHEHRLHVDRYGDPFFGKRLDVQNTPFSQVSMDTTGTSHAEVSEAMAINIYPHQNKSLLIVDHSNKPSESSSLEQYRASQLETPKIRTTNPNGDLPSTPPQLFSMDDIDSPLRNPRAPPEPPALPPAINFIPATPSGMTPAVEKQQQLGNYYDMTAEEKPQRRPSLLQRTFSRGRRESSYYGPSPTRPTNLLTRTLSLSRNYRKSREWESDRRPRRHSIADDGPADETRLHPFWRPSYIDASDSDSDDTDSWVDERLGGRTYKYPRIDNRPNPPRRSLSARMKRTFAILPIKDEYDAGDPLDKRTIRRTPSGNLRVMKFRRSLESMPRLLPNDGRPYTAPEGDKPRLRFWGRSGGSLKRRNSLLGNGFLPTLGQRINIPRRMSERRRERRNQELRRMISAPREVRDGVGDVIRRGGVREGFEAMGRV
ncbi:hypothetical protein OQA88_1968 [Cercophora sp. LCS_1]